MFHFFFSEKSISHPQILQIYATNVIQIGIDIFSPMFYKVQRKYLENNRFIYIFSQYQHEFTNFASSFF